MNEFVSQFLLEARELIEQGTQDLLALEQNPSDTACLDSAFRAFHTLKGAAAIMEYGPMERLLHQAEDTLQRIRSGSAGVTPPVIDACLASLGQITRWVEVIERDGELPGDAEESGAETARQLDIPGQFVNEPARDWIGDFMRWARTTAPDAVKAGQSAVRYEPPSDAFFKGIDPLALIETLPGVIALRLGARNPWPSLEHMQPFDCNLVIEALSSAARPELETTLGVAPAGLQIAEIGPQAISLPKSTGALARVLIEAQVIFAQTPRPPEAFAGAIGSAGRLTANILRALGREVDALAIETSAARAIAEGVAGKFVDAATGLLNTIAPDGFAAPVGRNTDNRREAGSGGIRVDIEKVDAIIDLTGELLVVKNALAHVSRLAADGADADMLSSSLRTHTSRLERHVLDLQRAVLDLRVLPLSRVFNRFPILVRDVAIKLGKQVTFHSEGEDTVADKAVVEALFEPLLHVVRNAIDHGIELPADRSAAGKPANANIHMRAWRQGDHVLVEVSDDGRGVDTSVVRRLAVERGVAAAEDIAGLNEVEALELLFAPGFTTATTVTDLSGRGVGMNAVRSALGRIGGGVSLTNQPGAGLAVRLTLPFTVMMTRVMTVEAGGQVFGIPFDAVLETVRVPRAKIKLLGAGEVIVLRDITMPVINLASSLKLDADENSRPAMACLVIASVAGQRLAIEIERPGERLDLMLKPFAGLLSGMKAVSGTSLLGDGRVLIVLDLGALLG